MKKSLTFVILFAVIAMTLYAAQIPIRGYVNADIGLNYRSGPSASASKLGALNNGTQMKFDGASGNWYHMCSPAVGYVCGDYIVVTEYGEAPEGSEDYFSDMPAEANTPEALEAEEAGMSEEEKDKLGCNIERSLIKSSITKAPPQDK